jgi:hypothetical protein
LKVYAGERLSPHGMCAGFITEAYLNGALDEQVMAHVRQKNVETTRRYRNQVNRSRAARPSCSISKLHECFDVVELVHSVRSENIQIEPDASPIFLSA